MEAVGRLFNVNSAMDGVWVSLRDSSAVTFVCYLGGAVGDTYTLQEARDASGTGAQNLATVERYTTCTGNGTDAWTVRSQAASATVVTAAAATQNQATFSVSGAELSDGYRYVKVTSTGAGTVAAVLHDLNVQRPANRLAAVGA